MSSYHTHVSPTYKRGPPSGFSKVKSQNHILFFPWHGGRFAFLLPPSALAPRLFQALLEPSRTPAPRHVRPPDLPVPSGPAAARRPEPNPSLPRAPAPPGPSPPVPVPPRAAAEASASAAATALGGLLASPLSTLEAALRSVNLAPLRAPVAAAMSAAVRWLGVYREVLLVGVLLSWFPNIPWDRQPFSALRDLCDPFLALCREVMPPVFGRKLDLSPLVAFMAIDIIIMILRPQPRM
ncbi:hypothetical protein HU200_050654 [Digitaria exilis]|uniref:YGGT family protein n=2 Tax=Paniceae TaxID=147428 RepID=A0A835AR97_9POAL|nr:hypothetical protein HU200_050654 [Digitaria exilis]